ncbi:MAG: pantetheine-phosphate adenylyltransferase [Chloroflexi bacterium]|nr:pantetheine-phosphate adenylyltransferase [Chloroflexota bacterium]
MVIAIYPGTFDPVTNGHVDIANRASRIFDTLYVAVYDLSAKTLLFDTTERVAFFTKAAEHLPNVKVMPYAGLTVDLAHRLGAAVIVRGLRAGADFEYEFEMALMTKHLAPEIEYVSFMSSLEYQFLSSTLLKEVARLKGNVESLVPAHVARALREKLQT